MKTEDIDKKISMPDVDAEWVKFERKVMGKKSMSRKLVVWGLSTAASITLLAGVLLLKHNIKETEPEVAQVTDSAYSGNNNMRLIGASNRKDSVLILIDGTPFTDTLTTIPHLAKDLYRQRRCIDSMMVYKDERTKEQYVGQYGERARHGVVVIKTAPDTLCDAYIREHPELMKNRRFVEGFVLNENGEPLADAWVHIIRGAAGTITDSAGHFAFWLPLTKTKLQAECTGYSPSVQVPLSDSILTFRLRKAILQKEVIRIREGQKNIIVR